MWKPQKQPSEREANPYASPQGAGDYGSDIDPNVGAWRDGHWLVMHVNAGLPPICVKTGQPAECYAETTIRWVQHLVPWAESIRVPLTRVAYRRHVVAPLVVFLATLLTSGLLVWIASLFDEVPLFLILSVVALPIATIVAGMRALGALGRLLTVGDARGKHLWLSGASPEFLRQLPKWEAPI